MLTEGLARPCVPERGVEEPCLECTNFGYSTTQGPKMRRVSFAGTLSVVLGSRPGLPNLATRRSIRTSSELTLARLAELLCVDLATVSRWERGEIEPEGTARLMYAALLDKLLVDQ